MKLTTSIAHFAELLETTISDAVTDAHPAEWDENHITYSWLSSIRRHFSHIRIASPTIPVEAAFRGYKLRGPTETQHGDVAIHVRLTLPDGSVDTGVGFLEAKARHRSRTSFPQLKIGQLRRIQKQSPRAMVLLYDYNPISNFRPSAALTTHPTTAGLRWRPFTHASTLPIDVAISTGLKNTKLYPHSGPLALQIADRYLFGLDLHRGQATLDRLSQFDVANPPSFVLGIKAALGGASLDVEETVEQQINLDRFEAL